jgi:hypothetical protein
MPMPETNPDPLRILQLLAGPDPIPGRFPIRLDENSEPERDGLAAFSRFRIRFFEIKQLYLCYKALRQTDERLRNAPAAPFDWQDIHAMSGILKFGLAWFDREFFNSLKNADPTEAHAEMATAFQLHPVDIRAEHWEFHD